MKILLDSPIRRDMAHQAIDAAGPGMEVIIQRHVPDGSREGQLRYLFSVVYPTICERILETSGKVVDVETLADHMLRRYTAPLIRRNKDGIEETVYSHDSMASNEARTKYIEKVTEYAVDKLGAVFPEQQKSK